MRLKAAVCLTPREARRGLRTPRNRTLGHVRVPARRRPNDLTLRAKHSVQFDAEQYAGAVDPHRSAYRLPFQSLMSSVSRGEGKRTGQQSSVYAALHATKDSQ